MFFTRLGIIIAHIAFWIGAWRVGIGFIIAFTTPDMERNAAASRRYLAAATSGEAISEGSIYLLIGVALGVLCEISARRAKTELKA